MSEGGSGQPAEPDGIFYGDYPALIDVDGIIADHVAASLPWNQLPFDPATGRRTSQAFESPLFRRKYDYAHECPYPDLPAPKLGEWIIPANCGRYARALLAFDNDEMTGILRDAFGHDPGAFYGGDYEYGSEDPTEKKQWGGAHNPLKLVYRFDGAEVERDMYALTPHCIDHDRQLWILPLVDVRYFWRNRLRARDLELLDEEEWEDLFPKIADQIDPSFAFTVVLDAIDDAYVIPDATYFKTEGLSAANAMDDAALSVGRRPIVSLDDDEIVLQTAEQARDVHAANIAMAGKRLGGTVPRHPISKELTLICRKLHNYFTNLDEPYYQEAELKTEQEVEYDYDATGSAFPILIWSTIWADFQNDEIVSISRIQIEDLANQIAIDLKEWSESYHVTSFAGIAEWELSGFDDYMSVAVRPSRNAIGIITTIKSLPPDFMPRLQLSQTKDLFTHSESGLIFRTLDAIPEATEEDDPEDGERKIITPGRGPCVAMIHDRETGKLIEKRNSAGDRVEFFADNLDPSDAVAADATIQAKQVDTIGVIDVEYCG